MPGYLVFYNKSFADVEKKIAFDFFEVVKLVNDPRALVNTSLDKLEINAELFEDGTGMTIEEPLLPTFMIENIEDMDTSYDKWETTRILDYNSKISQYNHLEDKKRRTYIYFPPGVIGLTDFIGAKKDSLRSKVELQLYSNVFGLKFNVPNGGQVTMPSYYILWKIGVKDSVEKLTLRHQQKDTSAALLIDGFTRLGLKIEDDSM
jgi:hypothetical protein